MTDGAGLVGVALALVCGLFAVLALVAPLLLVFWSLPRRRPPPGPRHRRAPATPLDDDLGNLDEDLAVRLLVLRAHVVGRRLADDGRRDPLVTLRTWTTRADEALPAGDGDLRRGAYGALTLAEVERTGTPGPWRIAAKRIGSKIAGRGTTDPYPLYLQVVDATTSKVETGNFADITRNGAVRVRLDETAAARALALDRDDVNAHRGFVFDE